MRIFDTHVHLFVEGGIPDAYEIGIARTLRMALKNRFGIEMALEEARENLVKGMYDPEGKRVLDAMEEAGIEKSVILGSDFGPDLGDPKIHPFEANEMYADVAKKNPDRFVALAAIDPRRPETHREVHRGMGHEGPEATPVGWLLSDR